MAFFALLYAGKFTHSKSKRPNYTTTSHADSRLKKSSPIGIPPLELISKLEEFGLKQDIRWKKSRVDPGWISQVRCYVDPSGAKTFIDGDGLGGSYNELNCQITGPDINSATLIEFEAELYDRTSELATLKCCAGMVSSCFPDCPSEVLKAITGDENLSLPDWTVEKVTNNAGYEIRVTYTTTPLASVAR